MGAPSPCFRTRESNQPIPAPLAQTQNRVPHPSRSPPRDEWESTPLTPPAYTRIVNHEESLIAAFVKRNKRARYREIVGNGMGTVLSCIPGQLAFVETEDERFILERPAPLEKREYIRFVVGHKDEDSHVEQGVFQAASRALENQSITGSDADELHTLRHWFNENLEKPTSFGRGSLGLGICWFKLAAAEHINQLWQMVRILERHGIYVRKIKTDKPGYVVYEDEWQLVAEPFRKGTLTRN